LVFSVFVFHFPYDHDVFQNLVLSNVLSFLLESVVHNFSPIVEPQNQWSFVDLEASHAFGVALDAHDVDFVADLHLQLDRFTVFIHSQQPARLDCWSQLKQHLVLRPQQGLLYVKAAEHHAQDATQGRNISYEFVGVQGVNTHEALSCVQHTLPDSDSMQVLAFPAVVLSQTAEHRGNPGVVGAEPDQAQTDDAVDCEERVLLLALPR